MEDHIMYDSTDTEFFRRGKSVGTESRWEVARAWEEGEWEVTANEWGSFSVALSKGSEYIPSVVLESLITSPYLPPEEGETHTVAGRWQEPPVEHMQARTLAFKLLTSASIPLPLTYFLLSLIQHPYHPHPHESEVFKGDGGCEKKKISRPDHKKMQNTINTIKRQSVN